MKTKILLTYLLIIFQIKSLKGRSEEFYKCINPQKKVIAASDCTNINIPEYEGYKCCSMIITYNEESSYSCLALERKYTTSQETLKDYISQNNINFLFTSVGGKMEIECGDNTKITENYKKISNEYLNCYNNHIQGIENENDCTKNDIPTTEGSKCCFVETSAENNDGNIVNDTRCYIIQDEYFTKSKNLSNFILDESNSNNLNDIGNTNVTITCKNFDKFYFSVSGKDTKNTEPSDIKTDNTKDNDNNDNEIGPIGNETRKKESGLKTWVIILIVLGSILFLGIIIFLIVFIYRKKNKESSNINKSSDIVKIKNNSGEGN